MQGVVFIFSPFAKDLVWNMIDSPENPVRKVITESFKVIGISNSEIILIPEVISKIPERIPPFIPETAEVGSIRNKTAEKQEKNIITAVILTEETALSYIAAGIDSARGTFFSDDDTDG